VSHVEFLDRIRVDLATLTDLVRWAHSDGYQPLAPNSGRSGGVSKPPPIPNPNVAAGQPGGPDWIPAAEADIGIGDHRRRRAYQATLMALDKIEVHLAWVVFLVDSPQPRLGHPHHHQHVEQVVAAIGYDVRRLNIIRHSWPALSPEDVEAATSHLEDAASQASTAAAMLAKVFIDHTAAQPLPRPCLNMQRGCPNPAAKGRSRCGSCYSWHRHHRAEKPKRLLRVDLDGPHQAQARRVGRGDGWGDESGSCTTTTRGPDL
jgi:hypothetical protein